MRCPDCGSPNHTLEGHKVLEKLYGDLASAYVRIVPARLHGFPTNAMMLRREDGYLLLEIRIPEELGMLTPGNVARISFVVPDRRDSNREGSPSPDQASTPRPI